MWLVDAIVVGRHVVNEIAGHGVMVLMMMMPMSRMMRMMVEMVMFISVLVMRMMRRLLVTAGVMRWKPLHFVQIHGGRHVLAGRTVLVMPCGGMLRSGTLPDDLIEPMQRFVVDLRAGEAMRGEGDDFF